jgi:hypothetical protein
LLYPLSYGSEVLCATERLAIMTSSMVSGGWITELCPYRVANFNEITCLKVTPLLAQVTLNIFHRILFQKSAV